MKKIKDISKILFVTVVILLLIEVVLGIYYNNNEEKRLASRISEIADSGAYDLLSTAQVKKVIEEEYSLNTKWIPFLEFGLEKFDGNYFNVDNSGRRATKTTNNDSNCQTIKIFCFGGSTMFGSGARNQFTIPSYIEKKMSKQFPNTCFEFSNYGCPGYHRTMENIQLELELLKGNIPDVVLFYDGVNEVSTTYQNNSVLMIQNAIHRQEEFKIKYDYKKRVNIFFKYTNINKFIKSIRTKFEVNTKPITRDIDYLSTEITKVYIENTKHSDALAKMYQFQVINIWQPVVFYKKHRTAKEEKYSENASYSRKLYDAAYRKIQNNEWLEKKPYYYNISKGLNGVKEALFIDYCHLGERGNKVVGNLIYEIMNKELLQIIKNED